ncbi:hypothetical protein SLEP1_g16307 [Rubroshorea leprosula]|uniref:Myb-like domain-containing protein n=1 Tax=Rubroshorea leprosula TaxID=152421 RepID=A0AAV5IQH0_9ROSI|nr:hypothetical protein SLEP1_g16307 [Rubroshorea leprosula]
MQQEGGGGGGGGSGSQSQYGEMSGGAGGGGPATAGLASTHMVDQSQQQLVEAASPISSRPPAAGNLDEFIRLSGGGDEDALGAAGEEGDRAGASSSNRWPRQETLALLKIRSDMDAAFRDATVKGPLWEDVSRKLAELGYKRSAKKCKEKFENVHKYYKRTKEGRAGRQDGKSYKFYTELEALHSSSAAAAVTHAPNVSMSVSPATAGTTLDVSPVSVGIPMQVPSARIPPNPSQPVSTVPVSSSIFTMPAPAFVPASQAPPSYTSAAAQFGISFSSDSSSSSERSEDDDDDEEELGGEPSTAAGGSRKRKRQPSRVRRGSGNTRRMMQFFEGLMKQVMQKQETMQQRFLEAIEKREQDRMIREEAWKKQEMLRLSREHELMAQERNVAASRDAAIVSFLQKITGQTIQLPTTVTIPTVTVTPLPTQPAQLITPAAPISTAAALQHQPPVIPQQTPPPPPQVQQQQQQLRHQHQPQPPQHRSQSSDVVRHQAPISSEVVMAIPEQTVPPQDIGGSGSSEPTSSRWPKPEVLALIKMRSGLESRYQEAGPKGPLWEEISTGMLQMGYKRSAKRCKEKWENINKYFKKVKESNKKRPEDAKTCPYFHELDALYKKKIIGSSAGASSSSFTGHQRSEEQTSEPHQQESMQVAPSTMAATQPTQAGELENESGASGDVQAGKEGFPESLFGEGNGSTKKPEDIMRELMEQQGIPQQQHQQPGQPLAVEDYEKLGEPDSDVMDEDEDDNEEDEDELEEDGKMSYKIEFQRQNTGPSNGGGNGTTSFLTMVQ